MQESRATDPESMTFANAQALVGPRATQLCCRAAPGAGESARHQPERTKSGGNKHSQIRDAPPHASSECAGEAPLMQNQWAAYLSTSPGDPNGGMPVYLGAWGAEAGAAATHSLDPPRPLTGPQRRCHRDDHALRWASKDAHEAASASAKAASQPANLGVAAIAARSSSSPTKQRASAQPADTTDISPKQVRRKPRTRRRVSRPTSTSSGRPRGPPVVRHGNPKGPGREAEPPVSQR